MSSYSPRRSVTFLDLKAQKNRIREELNIRISRVMNHCQFVLGPEVAELEKELAEFSEVAHAVGVSSGTDALQIVMMGAGIGPNDAVFLPSFTYTATAEVPLILGATPVFVDVDSDTFQIDIDHLRYRIAQIRGKGSLVPRAIVGVDLFGQPAPWKALKIIADSNNMLLIDDCAQAYGAVLGGRRLGGHGPDTTLSFFPSKPLGCYGDGGAILTFDKERADLYRSLRSHGEGQTRYDVLRIGMNARLDTLQAAVLLAKMTCFSDELKRRECVADRYDELLRDAVKTPSRVSESTSAWAVYAVLLPNNIDRDILQAKLREMGIPTAVYYPVPLHCQPAYRSVHDGESLSVSEKISRRILALPIHPELTDDEIDYIGHGVKNSLATT